MEDFALDKDDLKRITDDLDKAKEKYGNQIKIARHCTLSGLCQEPGHFYTVTARGSVTPCLMREYLAVGDISKDDLEKLLRRVDKIKLETTTHSSVKDLQDGIGEERNLVPILQYA